MPTGLPPQAPAPPALVSFACSRVFGILYGVAAAPIDVVRGPPGGARPAPGAPDHVVTYDDSLTVIALDPASRRIDTVTRLSSGRIGTLRFRADGGRGSVGLAPFPFVDEYAVLSDGRIVVLRSRELRLEWIDTGGARTSSQRLPYDWKRIDEQERVRMLDSINDLTRRPYETYLAQWLADSAVAVATGRGEMRPSPGRGGMRFVIVDSAPARGGEMQVFVRPRPEPEPLAEIGPIPDYRPPTARGALLVDPGDNAWIRILEGDDAESVYLVVDRNGEVVDRVRVPTGRTVVGLVPGAALLIHRDAGAVMLEKVRIR